MKRLFSGLFVALAACTSTPDESPDAGPTGTDAGAAEVDAGPPPGARPTASIAPITNTARGDVTLKILLADADASRVSLKVEYQLDGSDTWHEAFADEGTETTNLETSEAGVEHAWTWWSAKAPGKGNFLGIKLRAVASDSGSAGEPGVSAPFDLINGVYLHALSIVDGLEALHAAAGDVDGDGHVDLVVGTAAGARLLRNANFHRSFFPALPSEFPQEPVHVSHVALADVDADRDLDVLLAVTSATSGSRRNRLYLNDGTGKFTDATTTHLPEKDDQSERALVGDVNGDGSPDVIFVNSGSQQDELYLNDGEGTFTDATSTHLPADTLMGSGGVLADFDGDRDLDLVTANFITSQGWRLALNDGAGHFTDATATKLPPQKTSGILMDVAAADVDADGDVDLYFADGLTSGPLLLNDGHGTFTEGPVPPVGGAGGLCALFADLNGDKLPELFVSRTSAAAVLLDNRNSGTFQVAPDWRFTDAPGAHRGAAAADFDGDGDLDLFVATETAGTSLVWWNDELAD